MAGEAVQDGGGALYPSPAFIAGVGSAGAQRMGGPSEALSPSAGTVPGQRLRRRRWCLEERLAMIEMGRSVALLACCIAAYACKRHGLHDGAASPIALCAVAGVAAACVFGARAFARRLPRRVLLLENARPEHARAALGEGPLELVGPPSPGEDLSDYAAAGLDDAVLARPVDAAEVTSISHALRDARIRVHSIDAGAPARDAGTVMPIVGSLPVRYLAHRRCGQSARARVVKRLVDLVAGVGVLLLVWPLLLLLALLVKLSSPGPVFFGQTRVGLGGTFRALKLRTMRVGAHLHHERLIAQHGNMFKLKADPRVTPIGRWLRRFSLDELPQLFQVIAGDMSLVGPRPPMPEEVARYTAPQLRRLGATPGLTGLWQVSGRADLSFEDCVELDGRYIERWSPGLELRIYARTVGAVLRGRGAY